MSEGRTLDHAAERRGMSRTMKTVVGGLMVIAVIAVLDALVRSSINREDAEAGAAPDPLAETRWEARSYHDAAEGGMVSPLPDSQLTAEFTAGEGSKDGQVGGSAGCNTYKAGYTVDGDSLSIGEASATRMFCEGLMEQEGAFLSAMQSASSFQLQAGELRILDDQGEVVVAFVPAP